MTKREQKAFVTALTRAVRARLLETSQHWPEEWDGHELRELLASAFQYERSGTMREPRSKRRKEFERVCLVGPRLY